MTDITLLKLYYKTISRMRPLMLTINTNISSLNAQRHLYKSQNRLKTSMERLSSGLRINSAKDDAAGLAISDRMTSQIRGMNQAIRNANDGISLAQTAEGALQEDVAILQRMRELAIQSANSPLSDSDRQAIESEFLQLKQEYDRIAKNTQFNGISLLDGTFKGQSFQVGPNAGTQVDLTIPCMATSPCHVESAPPVVVSIDAIDIVFLLDTTGSMGTALNELRNEISSVISDLQTRTDDLSVGIIAYSDVYAPDNTVTFELTDMDPTGETQLDTFLTTLAEGGGIEMLGQAIQEASALSWDESANQLILVLGSAGDEADDEAVALQAAQDFNDSSDLRTVSALSANGTSAFFQDLVSQGGGEYDEYTPGNLIDVIGDISDEIVLPPPPEEDPDPGGCSVCHFCRCVGAAAEPN